VTEIDEAIIVVGLPKHGKSTTLRRTALEFLQKYPTGIVLAHDPNEELCPDITHAYKNVAAWREAQAKGGAPRGASFTDCTATELGALVIELGERHNRAKDVRVPMLYALDENSENDTSGPTFQGQQDRRIWSRRRHFGVVPFLNTQMATDVNIKFWRAATTVVMFAQSEQQARHLEQILSLPEGALEELVNAEKFRYLVWRAGEGLVSS